VWRSESGSLAETIENALYHENETHSFDTVLDNACARYVTEVKAAVEGGAAPGGRSVKPWLPS
jgi:hypothetical protein